MTPAFTQATAATDADQVQVLLVEDDPVQAEYLRGGLVGVAGWNPVVATADNLATAIERVQSQWFDVALLDLGLPDSSGLDTYMQFRQAAPRLPTIILTAAEVATIGMTAMQRGAQDFLAKAQAEPTEIVRAIRFAIERVRRQEATRAAAAALDELDEVRRMEAYRQWFMNRAAHELNTPLTPILLQLELLELEVQKTEHHELAPRVAKLSRNLRRLVRLASDVLTATQAQQIGPQRRHQDIDLGPILIQAVREIEDQAHKRNITIQVDGRGPLPIHGDPRPLRYILDELLNNAVKFGHPGGRIEIRSSTTDGHTTIEVEDEGIGFATERAKQLFEPFARHLSDGVDAPAGNGLGLYVAHAIALAHRGTLEARSGGPGTGATFSLMIPRAPWPGAGAASPRPESAKG